MIDIFLSSTIRCETVKNKRLKIILGLCVKLIIPVNVEVGEDKVADCEAEHRKGDGEAVEEAAGDLLVVQAGDHQLRVQRRVETREVMIQLSVSGGEFWK